MLKSVADMPHTQATNTHDRILKDILNESQKFMACEKQKCAKVKRTAQKISATFDARRTQLLRDYRKHTMTAKGFQKGMDAIQRDYARTTEAVALQECSLLHCKAQLTAVIEQAMRMLSYVCDTEKKAAQCEALKKLKTALKKKNISAAMEMMQAATRL